MSDRDTILELVRRFWPITSLHGASAGPFVPGQSPVLYAGPTWSEDEVVAAIETLLSGRWLTSGDQVRRFESRFAQRISQSGAVMTNSGSSANLLMVAALRSKRTWGLEAGEIITPVSAFPTTVAPILQNGFTPVFVDIEPRTLNLDLDALEAAITPRTRAVMFAHVLGVPPDLDRVVDLCARHDLLLLEDNCDALGSTWDGRPTGSFGVMSTCSFYPAHHLTTAEGGAVATSDDTVEKVLRSLCWWGRDCYCVGKANLLADGTCGTRFQPWLDGLPDVVLDHKYVFAEVGYNLKPLDLQGAIGLVQLDKLDDLHAARRRNFSRLRELFARWPGVFEVVTPLPKADPSWFGCPVRVTTDRFGKADLTRWLEASRIQTRNVFAGNLLHHPGFAHLGDASRFPVATDSLRSCFFLGVSPNLTDDQLGWVEDRVAAFVADRA